MVVALPVEPDVPERVMAVSLEAEVGAVATGPATEAVAGAGRGKGEPRCARMPILEAEAGMVG